MMKRHVSVTLSLLSLLVTGCSIPSMPDLNLTGKKPSAEEQAAAQSAANNLQCRTRAESRLALFDRPDTYPISSQEKQNAFDALYAQCMKEFDVTIATPKPNFQPLPTGDASLAALSPAAGGPAKPAAQAGAVTYSNGMMIIDTSKLGALSPAAGGAAAGTAVSTTGPNGSTVVVVQAPPSTTLAYPAAPAGPAAIAVPGKPLATTAAPAAGSGPKSLMVEEQPKAVGKTKKNAKASSKKTAPTAAATSEAPRTVIFEPSRFRKNAEAVKVDLGSKKSDFNAYQPAAGMVDSAIITNRPAPKD